MNIIENLKVANFRSHDNYELILSDPTTLIIGPNGSGKTSLLEAIYILLQGKSFRSNDSEIIKKLSSFYRIELILSDKRHITASYESNINKKTFSIDQKKTTRLPLSKKYPVILFEPEDLHLLHSSPGKRRDFLDALISQIDPEFHRISLKYTKILKQRNDLLKGELTTIEQLSPWDQLLANYASKIISGRISILTKINNNITNLYNQIAGDNSEINLKYKNSLSSTCNTNLNTATSDYLCALKNNLRKDKILGRTTVGPHLDDLLFDFNSAPMVLTASRGEIRSAVLALKFIESKLVLDFTGKKPVVLLDDIFSELDEIRQRRLVNEFQDHQVIITSVSAPPGLQPNVSL